MRIAIIEDDRSLLDNLKLLLNGEPGITVVVQPKRPYLCSRSQPRISSS